MSAMEVIGVFAVWLAGLASSSAIVVAASMRLIGGLEGMRAASIFSGIWAAIYISATMVYFIAT